MEQAADAEQAIDVERATHVEQAADVEQAAGVMRTFQEIQQDISNRRQRMLPVVESNRRQTTPHWQVAAADRGQQVAPGYYGPQPGQRAAGLTADGSRQKRAPPQAVAGSKQQDSGSSNKQAKARQSVQRGGERKYLF